MNKSTTESRTSSKKKKKIPLISPERLDELQAMPYAEYLKSPEWQTKRLAMIGFARGRCQLCNGPGPFNVHHRAYKNERGISILGLEKPWDLVCLCAGCHETFHTHLSLM